MIRFFRFGVFIFFAFNAFPQSVFNKDISPESPFLFNTNSLTKSKQSNALSFPGSSGEIDWIDLGYSIFDQSVNKKQTVSNSVYLIGTLHPYGNHLIAFSDIRQKNSGEQDRIKQQFLYSFSVPVKSFRQRIGFSIKYNFLDHFVSDSTNFSGYDVGLDMGYYQSNIFPFLSFSKEDYLEGGFRFGITVKNLLQYSELHRETNKKEIEVIKNDPDLILGLGYLAVNKENLKIGTGYSLGIQSNKKNKFELLLSNHQTRYDQQLSANAAYKNWSLDFASSFWTDKIDNQSTLSLGFQYRSYHFFVGRNYYGNSSSLFLTCQLNYKEKMF